MTALSEVFNMLQYKAEWYNCELVTVGQYFPSTRKCHCCGYITEKMDTEIRNWTCPKCGTELDRDGNAAMNIWQEGENIKPVVKKTKPRKHKINTRKNATNIVA